MMPNVYEKDQKDNLPKIETSSNTISLFDAHRNKSVLFELKI